MRLRRFLHPLLQLHHDELPVEFIAGQRATAQLRLETEISITSDRAMGDRGIPTSLYRRSILSRERIGTRQ